MSVNNLLVASVNGNKYKITNEVEYIKNLLFSKFKVADYNLRLFKPHEFINVDENELYSIDLTLESELLNLFKFDKSINSYQPLESSQIEDIDYIILMIGNYLIFQNITKRNLVRKSFIKENLGLMEASTDKKEHGYTLSRGEKIMTIDDSFDFVYDCSNKHIYFQKITDIISIFPGFSKFFREAVEADVISFSQNKFLNITYTVETIEGIKKFFLPNDEKGNKVEIGSMNLKSIAIFTDKNLAKNVKMERIQLIVKEFDRKLKIIDNQIQIKSNKDITEFLKIMFSRYHMDLISNQKMENSGARALNK